ncbi:MAG: glycosyl hydrolase family 17 protein [Verrucomicrobia bacterium]|nr:glycosyl hydrolase family 17 protein [Verrucomicrobiota bacterium]
MKPVPHHKTLLQRLAGPALCAAALSLLTACDRPGPAPAAPETGSRTTPIQQEPGDLLCGITKAVCYSGFRQGQHPDRGDGAVNPTDEEVLEDLRILNRNGNFKLIRLYDSQVNSEAVLRLIKAHDLDIKVVLGAWLDAEVNNPDCPWHPQPYPEEVLQANLGKNAAELDRAIRLANEYPDIVVAVAVGNEALVSWNDHMVPVESVIQYVRKVKQAIAQPVTVADNHDWWAKHGADLAKEVDFVSVHIYPIWEGKDIDEAMAFGTANMQAVRDALPDSQLVITEAGWATVASEFGPRASEAKQKQYYHDLFDWAGRMNITTFFFEAFDESWKGEPGNPLGAEKHWGLFTEERTPKLVMQDLYPDLMPDHNAE